MSDHPWDISSSGGSERFESWEVSGESGSQGRSGFDSHPPTEEFAPVGSGSAASWAAGSGADSARLGGGASAFGGTGRGSKKSAGRGRVVLALVLGVLVFVAGGVAVFFVSGGNEGVAAMSYVSAKDSGPDPFMGSTTSSDVQDKLSSSQLVGSSVNGAVSGADPNLYGGSGQVSVCDAALLIDNLKRDGELNAAFASGVGINAGDVERYIGSLQSVVLRQDTWVTNHGFSHGKATPFQAVLQRGTAVMVDARGVPRVRCSCGNPLAEAWDGYTAPSAVEFAWDGYRPDGVATVYGSEDQSDELDLTDIKDGSKSSVAFGEGEREVQSAVEGAVTGDTPVTSPKDMGVKPDKKLLGDLGMPAAGSAGGERPSGGARFDDAQGWTVPGGAGAQQSNFPDWKSQTTMVDADDFNISEIPYGNHFVAFRDQGVGCFVPDNRLEISCHVNSFNKTDLKMPMHNGPNSMDWPVNMLVIQEGISEFFATGWQVEDPLNAYRDAKSLMPGQSVKIGQLVCFNVDSKIGCEAPKSKFHIDGAGAVFVNGSKEPLGATCGSVAQEKNGKTFSVKVAQGAPDCRDALETVREYINTAPSFDPNKNPSEKIGSWLCHPNGDSEYALGSCSLEEKPFNTVEIRFK